MMDLYELISKLEEEFYDSKGFLWSKKSLVDVDKCISILTSIKDSIPPQVYDLDAVRKEKDKEVAKADMRATRIVEEAIERGNLIIKKAQDEADRLLDESEIVNAAEQEADRIAMVTKKTMDEYEMRAMGRLQKLFSEMEAILSEALTVVHKSKSDIDDNIKQLNAENSKSK